MSRCRRKCIARAGRGGIRRKKKELKRSPDAAGVNEAGYTGVRIRELDSVPKSRRTAINPFFVKGRGGRGGEGLISSQPGTTPPPG